MCIIGFILFFKIQDAFLSFRQMYGAKPGILADSTSSSSLYHMHVSYMRYIPQFLANM